MMLSIASDQKHRKMTVNYVLKIAIKLLALIFSQPPPPDLGRAEVEEGVYKRRCILCMMLSIASDQKHRKMTVNYVLKIAIKLLALIFSQPPPPDLGRAEVEEGVYKRRCILCMMLSIASDQKHRKMTVNYVLKIAIKLLALIFSQPPPPDLGRAEVEEGVYKRRCILCMMLSIASDQKHRKMTVNYVLKIAIKLLALIFSQPPPPDLGRAEVEEGVYKRRCILCMMLSIASDQKHRKMTVNYVLKIAIKLLALIFSQPPPPDLGRAEVEEGVYKRRCILCMMLSIASDQKHRKMTVNYVLKIAIKLLALIFSQPPPPDLGRAEVEEGVYKRRCILCMMLSIASDQKHRKMTVNYVLKIAIKLLALIFSQPPPPDLGRAEVEEGVYKRRCILCMMLSIASDQKHRKMTVNYVLKIAIKLLALIFSQPPPPDLGRAEVEEGVYKRRCILCMMLSIASDQKHRKMTVNYVLKIAIKLLALIFSQPPPPDLGRAEVEEGVYKRRCILCMMLSIASDQKHRKMTVNYVLKIAIKLLALIFSQPPPPDLGRAEVEEGVYKRRCILCMMLSIASDQKHRKMTVNYVLKIAIKLLALIFSQPPPPDLGRAEVEEGVYKRRCILCMMLSIASDQKHRKMTVNYVLKIAIKLLALIFSQPPPPDLGRAEVEEGVYKRRCILCMMLSIASDQKHRKMTVNYVLKIAIKLLALIFSQPPPPDLGRAEVEEGVYKRRCILCMMLSIASDQKHRKMTVNYVLKIAIKLLALIFSQPPPPDLGRAEVEEGVYKRRCILCMMLSIASDQKHRKMTVNYVLKIAIKLLALIFSQPPPPDLGRAEVEEGVYKRRCILCMMLSIASDQKHRKMTVNYVLKIAIKLLALIFSQPPPPDLGRAEVEEGVYKRRCILCMMLSIASDQKHRKMTVNYVLKIAIKLLALIFSQPPPPDLGRAEVEEGVYKRRCILCMMLSIASDQKHRKMTVNYVLKIAIKLLALIFSQPPPPDLGRAEVEEGVYKRRCILCMMLSIASDQKHRKMTVNYVLKIAIKLLALIFSQPPPPDLGRAEVEEGVYKRRCILCMMLSIASDQKHRKMTVNYVLKIAIKLLALIFSQPPPPDLGRAEVEEGVYKRRCILCMMLSIASDQKHRKMTVNYVLKIAIKLLALIFSQPPPPDLGRAEVEEGVYKRRCILCMMLSIASDQKHRKMTVNYVLKIAIKLLALIFSQPPPPDLGRAEVEEGVYKRRCILCMMLSIASDQKHRKMTVNYVLKIAIKLLALIFSQPPPPDLGRAEVEEGVYKRRCILCMMLSIASDQKHRKMTVNYVLKIAIKLLALIFSQPPPPDLGRAEVEEGVYKRRCILCMMLSIASDQKHRKMTVNYVLKIAIKLLALIFSQPPPPDLGRAEVEEGVYKRRCILCMMLSIASDQKHRKMTVNYVLKIAIKLLALIFSQPPPPDLGRAEVEEGVYKRRCILCMMLSIASDQKHRKMTVNYVLKIAIKLLALIFSQPPPPDLGRAEVEEGVYKRRCILCMMLSIASDQKHRKMTVNYVLKIAIKLLALIFSQPPPPDLGRRGGGGV